MDLDLHGASYGYTPMGDDNEMEDFRIWKTGYWKQFLRGSVSYRVIELMLTNRLAAHCHG